MITTHFAFAKKLEDGTEVSYSIGQWATDNLTAEEFAAFDAANTRQNALVEAAVAAGKITIVPDLEPESGAPVPGSIDTGIDGQRYATGASITATEVVADPDWLTFWDRFVADPTVIRK